MIHLAIETLLSSHIEQSHHFVWSTQPVPYLRSLPSATGIRIPEVHLDAKTFFHRKSSEQILWNLKQSCGAFRHQQNSNGDSEVHLDVHLDDETYCRRMSSSFCGTGGCHAVPVSILGALSTWSMQPLDN